MGRLSPDYSEEERAAVVAAVLEHGLSAREAAEAAAAGELGLDPFEPSTSTVQGWVVQHKRREVVDASGHEEAERVRATAQKTIGRIEAMDSPSPKDLTALREALRAVNAADRAAPRPPPPKKEMSPEGRALLARMLADLAAIKRFEAGGPCGPHHPSPHGPYCQRCSEPLDELVAKRAQAEEERVVAAALERLEREEGPPAA